MLVTDWSRADEYGTVSLMTSSLRGYISCISRNNVMSVIGSVVGSDFLTSFKVKLGYYFWLASYIQSLK